MTNAYLERVLTAAETDPAIVQQFLRSINMIDPPSRMLRPSTVLRVMETKPVETASKPLPGK
jgi:hypothetical protein